MSNIEVPVVVGKIYDVTKPGDKKKDESKNGGDGEVEVVENKVKHRLLPAGCSGVVKIKVAERHRKLCLETFENCRPLGRFVLRRNGDTVGMGVISELIDSHKKDKKKKR